MEPIDPRLARWRNPPPDRDIESAREDVEPHLHQSMEERLADLAVLCRSAMKMVAQQPAALRERILEHDEPLSPEDEAAWRRLVAQGRGRRA